MSVRVCLGWMAAAAILTFLSLVLHGLDDPARRTAPGQDRLFPGRWADLRVLQVSWGLPPVATARLERGDAGDPWRVSLDGRPADAADPAVVDELQALVQLGVALGPPPDAVPPPPGRAVQLSAGPDGASLATLTFDAAPRADGLAVARRGQRLLAVDAGLLRPLRRGAGEYVSRRLFDPDGRLELAALALVPGAGAGGERLPPCRMTRQRDGWLIEEPVRWPADPEAVQDLLRLALDARAAESWPDDGRGGLEPGAGGPSMTLVFRDGQGRTVAQSARFGDPDPGRPGHVFAIREGRPARMSVPSALADRLRPSGTGGAEAPPAAWVEPYRLRTLPFAPAGRARPAAFRITPPDGRRMTLSPPVPGSGGPWRAAVRGPDGDSARTFWADPGLAEELRAYLAGGIEIDRFLAEEGAQAATAGMEGWTLEALGADGASLASVWVGAAAGPEDAAWPPGWLGPPRGADPDRGAGHVGWIGGRGQLVRFHPRLAALATRPLARYRWRIAAPDAPGRLLAAGGPGLWLSLERGGDLRRWEYRPEGGWRSAVPEGRVRAADDLDLTLLALGLCRPADGDLRELDDVAAGFVAGFVAEGAGEGDFGLDPPEARMQLGAFAVPGGDDPPRTLATLELGRPAGGWGLVARGSRFFGMLAGGAERDGDTFRPSGMPSPVYARLEGSPEIMLWQPGSFMARWLEDGPQGAPDAENPTPRQTRRDPADDAGEGEGNARAGP